ncbi:hypothetical protein [Microlunatus antarcticus]|uniref:Uncharacterized protein n=1 Tax=Microlunatus antarcticus TaxID=53388 RepID=A0A7W5P7D8_9ACTN|nr:hypothetical protein [Microlunatus antarcticus]MBB3327470.1 hypothetical protein [Microlunatus antarcticus]
MPRLTTKRQTAVECVAHGQRCALFAGRGYRSSRCEPAEAQPRQLTELFALMGVDPVEQQRRDTRPLAEQDADYWRALEQAKAGNAEREAALSRG